MKKNLFWKIYGIVVGIIVISIIFILRFAWKSIERYDRALPEHLVEETIEAMKAGSADISYPEINISRYDALKGSAFKSYEDKIKGVKEWSYKVSSGSTSNTETVYGIFGDNELLAYLTLKSSHSEIVLGMLTVNDWKKATLTPVMQLSTYTLTVDIPTGFTAKANGVELAESEEDVEVTSLNGNTLYKVTDIFELPEVVIFDRSGKECTSSQEDGYVSVENVTYYSLVLPDSIEVMDGDIVMDGAPEEGDSTQKKYVFGTMNDSITLVDILGQSLKYHKNDELVLRDVNVTVPENYTVHYKGHDVQGFIREKAPNKRYKYILELNNTVGEGAVAVPENHVYSFLNLLAKPEFDITDNLGGASEYTYDKNNIVIDDQAGFTVVPEPFKKMGAIGMAVKWSEFSQGSLGTGRAAFDNLATVLIRDSYLYNAAYMVYKSGDLNRIVGHTTEIQKTAVRKIVVFSDDLVSCDIYIKKLHHMHAVQTATGIMPPHDTLEETTDTYYFYKYNGAWKLVDVKVSEDKSFVELGASVGSEGGQR